MSKPQDPDIRPLERELTPKESTHQSFQDYIDYILLLHMEDVPISDEVYQSTDMEYQYDMPIPNIYLNLSYDSMIHNMYSWRKKVVISYDSMAQLMDSKEKTL